MWAVATSRLGKQPQKQVTAVQLAGVQIMLMNTQH
jgi:hypothetical protein